MKRIIVFAFFFLIITFSALFFLHNKRINTLSNDLTLLVDLVSDKTEEIQVLKETISNNDLEINSLKENTNELELTIKNIETETQSKLLKQYNKIENDELIVRNNTIIYGDHVYDLLYKVNTDVKVYYRPDGHALVKYSDGAYLLKDKTLESVITSRPLISPNLESMIYMAPFESGLNTSVYLYNFKEQSHKKLIQANMFYDESVKKVRWLDDNNLILIIGSSSDLWSKNNALYHFNVTDNKLNYLEGFMESSIDISNFIFKSDKIDYDIRHWDENMKTFTLTKASILYEELSNYNKETLDSDIPRNSIDLEADNLRVKKGDLKRLVLDDKAYNMPYDFLLTMQNDYISIDFPYAKLNKSIYDLEREEIVLDMYTIKNELEQVWGKSVAKGGYQWNSDVKMSPANLNFLKMFEYNSYNHELIFSIESFWIEMIDSLIGVYNLKTKEIKFISKPFYGSVNEIEVLDGTNYIAYSYFTAGDTANYYINILDLDTMDIIKSFDNEDIIKNLNIKGVRSVDIYITALKCIDNKLIVSGEISYDDSCIDIEEVLWSY